jgi:ATP/maltotriose-dependent transcriptional regulator MalT
MSIPLLRTKFNFPPTITNLVRRERLLKLLNEGLRDGHLLTLICAPTGYGKTTLVSQWVQEYQAGQPSQEPSARQFIWLTLDSGDNDLARFVRYLVAGLQQISSTIGQGVVRASQNVRSTAPHVLVTMLINDLTVIDNPITLILEDYHILSSQSIQDFMSYFIDHQPRPIHLVVITRSDPSLPLARLRARGQLTEIRQRDLALTEPETADFMLKNVGLELSQEQLQILLSRTEGWVAGLRLAGLAMRQTENIQGFIRAFSGGHDYIADYLTGEVLEQQDEVTKDFLLQTSILKQLSAPLCEAVTGLPQAVQVLEKLVNDNIFLVSLDDRGEWYRYHALFADLLRKRLQQSKKEVLVKLHGRAGLWYAQNFMLEQAVEHFLAGEDYSAAASQIEEHIERILMHGQTATFLRWLEAFPVDELFTHPVLVVYQGVAMMLQGKIPDNALAMIREISSSTAGFRGESEALQAIYSVMKGNSLEAIRLSESALQQLPANRAFLRILAADSQAMGYALRGDLTSAAQAFEKVVEAAQRAGNVIMKLIGLSNLAGLYYQQGHLHQAWDGYQQVLDISQELLGGCSQPMGRVLLGMGELKREWNDLDGARKYLTEAAEMFAKFVDIGLTMADLSLARVYLAQMDWDKVQALLEESRQHSRASKTTTLDDNLTELMQARLWIAMGELDQAEHWARRRGLLDKPMDDLLVLADSNATAFELIQGEYLTLVRLLLARKETGKALDILEAFLMHNEKRAQTRRVIEILVLQAIAYQQQGEGTLAMSTIVKALTLAEPEGYVRSIIDEGKPVAQLLYQATTPPYSISYAKTLLFALTEQEFPSNQHEKMSTVDKKLVEPLSEREIEVLGLIAEGLTNQQIGRHLHISLSTVKGHTTNIYGKLGVRSRTQAVTLARSLGLLTGK